MAWPGIYPVSLTIGEQSTHLANIFSFIYKPILTPRYFYFLLHQPFFGIQVLSLSDQRAFFLFYPTSLSTLNIYWILFCIMFTHLVFSQFPTSFKPILLTTFLFWLHTSLLPSTFFCSLQFFMCSLSSHRSVSFFVFIVFSPVFSFPFLLGSFIDQLHGV